MSGKLARPAASVQEMDRELFGIINNARQNPKCLIPHLQEMEKRFTGKLYRFPDKTTVETQEGTQAVAEAIAFLKKQGPVAPLSWHNDLAECCRLHVEDTGSKGLHGHNGSRGSCQDRLLAHGEIVHDYGENLSYHCHTAMEVILHQIVDDGIRDRSHRKNLFNPEYRLVGCHTGDHNTDHDVMTAINFCHGFLSKGEEHLIEQQLDAFLEEQVDFPDMPKDVMSFK